MFEANGFMESGEGKRNEDNKADTARIGWGGIRKTDLNNWTARCSILGRWSFGGGQGPDCRSREIIMELVSPGQSPRGHREYCLA